MDDLYSPKTVIGYDDLKDLAAEDAQLTANYEAKVHAPKDPYRRKTLFGKYVLNPALNTLPGLAVENLAHTTLTLPDDDGFQFKEWDAKFQAVKNDLSEDYWHYLEDAKSAAQFDARYALAKTRQTRRNQIAESGLATTADFLAQALDPVSNLAFNKAGAAVNYASKIGKLPRYREAAMAGAMTVAGAGTIGAREALGEDAHASEYAMAIGLGALWGGISGYMGRNPAIAHEASKMAEAGQKAIKEAEDLAKPKPEPKTTQAAVKRAANEPETTEQFLDQFVDKTPKQYAKQPDMMADEWIDNTFPATTHAIEHVIESVTEGVIPDTAKVQAAVDEITAAAAPTPSLPQAPKQPEGGALLHDYEKAKAATTRAAGDLARIKAQAEHFKAKRAESRPQPPKEPVPATLKGGRPTIAVLDEAEKADLAKANPNATGRQLMMLRKMAEKRKLEKLQSEWDAKAALPDPNQAHIAAGRVAVLETLKRIAPRGAHTAVEASLKLGKQAVDGFYRAADKLIAVALNGRSPVGAAFHEVGHALRHLGHINPAEWKVLVRKAAKIKAHERYDLDRYARAGNKLSKEALEEEAVMHMIAERASLGSFGGTPVQKIMDRVITVFSAIKKAMTGRGITTAESIFRDMDSGAMAARLPEWPLESVFHDADVMAAMGPVPATPRFTQDPDWVTLLNDRDKAPRGARPGWLPRFDNAGAATTSDNPALRLIGPTILNESVGFIGHEKNPFSADLAYRQIHMERLAEYDQVRIAALREWAADQKLGPIARAQKAPDFYRDVTRYIRGGESNPHPAVKRLGDAVAKLQEDILKDLQNPLERMNGRIGRPIGVASVIPENKHYAWRKFDYDAVGGAIEKFGLNGVTKMVRGAILDAQPHLGEDPALLDRIATGYVHNIRAQAAQLGDEWSIAWEKGDYENLKAILMDEAGARIDPADVDNIIQRIRGADKDPAAGSQNLKRRLFLSENYVDPDTGLKFTDLLENDINKLFTHYSRRAAGLIALGRVRVNAPDGTLLVDQLTSQSDITRMLENVRKIGLDVGRSPDRANKDVELLRWAINRVRGFQDPIERSNFALSLRLLNRLNSMRLNGQFGVAQLGETTTPVASIGLKAIMSHLPDFKRAVTKGGEFKFTDEFMQELESIGIGAERLHGLRFDGLDAEPRLPFETADTPFLQKADNYAAVGERLSYEASLLPFLQHKQDFLTASGIAHKIANTAVKYAKTGKIGRGDARRLAQLGLKERELRLIFNNFKHADTVPSTFFGNGLRINRLNLDKWDMESAFILKAAIFRGTRKYIQAVDEGNDAFFMSHFLSRTAFQFRRFSLTAWGNNFLHNIHMGDPAAFVNFTSSVMFNGLLRAAQVKLAASLRADGAEYEDKYLTPWELAKAGFQRGGWSSIIPMITDSGLRTFGFAPMFNARATGQPSDVLFGSPSMSFVNSAMNGPGMVFRDLREGRVPSQKAMRDSFSLLPFQNNYLMGSLLSTMIKNNPLKSPKLETE